MQPRFRRQACCFGPTVGLGCVFMFLTGESSLLWAQTPAGVSPADPTVPTRVEVVRKIPSSYALAPNDLLYIKVFQEEELDTTARVSKDGTITFPLVGSVLLGGRSLGEAVAVLSLALKEYLVHPQVSVRIMEYSKRRITVLGQVNRPGIYDIPEDSYLTLLEGIGLAGGYSRIANPSKVTVKRSSSGGGEEVFKLDAKQMARSRGAPSFLLQAGDTVVVEESLF
jgi:protein involved in polysaccharide export with SLBB domain